MVEPTLRDCFRRRQLLILVDSQNTYASLAISTRPLAMTAPAYCIAFSLFIFNSQGQLLLQQRAANKRLWGGYWSNFAVVTTQG